MYGNVYVESVSVATGSSNTNSHHGFVEIVLRRKLLQTGLGSIRGDLRVAHKQRGKTKLKANVKRRLPEPRPEVVNVIDDLGMLLIGSEKLTITKIRLIEGTISFEAKGVCQNDYALGPITGVTILDTKRNIVYSEPEYEIPKLKTLITGDKISFIFNLDPQLHPKVEMWVRAK